ncbi:MAG: glycosyltransferase [Flavobacterium sp.]|nr:MAG: glycosyltransferase [Flavobacterium sp.]
MSEAIISVITACFNHGLFIDEAISSVSEYAWNVPVEHIIINDGSTDDYTINKLEELRARGVLIIDQVNAGPANARNAGIAASTGEYILPLDADNKLVPAVFEKALSIMEEDKGISVVYTNARYFGVSDTEWKPGQIDPLKFLAGNYLDTCALVRKKALTSVGGYDDQIPYHGNEDWDLWLNFIFNDYRFFYLEETGYEYREVEASLSKRESTPNQAIINDYIVKKYAKHYAQYYRQLYSEKSKYEYLKHFLRYKKLRSIMKIILNKKLIEY